MIAASLVASSAYAQDAAKPATAADSASEEDGGAIVVTGSRIRLPNLINVEPTVSVSQQYLQDRGLTNVADALNEIPGYRGSVTPAGAQGSFGQGVNFINSYGLGSNRSLTLLNGRRVVSSNVTTIFGNASPGTQVDLNIIPVILVDRIDRVSIGG
ncbi:MAG: TonB-dependent receptor, partial [Sphingomonadaceae bacterium]|nr:TonB-dependent receptor [Sphingomonadaceae bacterium]